VTFYKDSANQFVGFEFLGHADAGEYGKDIVCASVSVLVFNTINSIEAFTDDDFTCDLDDDTGMIRYHLNGKLSNESIILMKSLALGVQGVQEDNEQYIKIVFEEV
jgi:uncharacterized protein YsxB (DUF464 family)